MSHETSLQQSAMPIKCASGCGFFGSAATMNLCSKCHRDHSLKEEAKTALQKSILPEHEAKTALEKSILPAPSVALASGAAVTKVTARHSNWCGCGGCKKKVGVLGFRCRCGAIFCGSHRHPEDHHCTFDHKMAGRNAIARANPLVKADKMIERA